ncbi:MAG: tyrosine recombinase [Clostridia bacterium]|nr:tyrosine recombinase [Clostridia bacterium]
MSRLVKKYITYLEKEKKLSKNTVESYIRDIRQLDEFAKNSGIKDLCDVTKPMLTSYIVHMQRMKKAPSSIARSTASLRSFYNFALISGYVEQDPTENLKIPKAEESNTPAVLELDEIKRLLDIPRTVDFKGYRDKAILELMYATGMKVSELISLRADEIDLDKQFIICGKGSHRRAVPIGEMAVYALTRYVENARNRQVVSEQAPELFLNLNGQALTRQGLWKILKDYKKRANITSEITPDTIRHTFAVHMLDNGVDMGSVQNMLGNVSNSTSALYKKMMEGNLSEVYKKAHPRAGRK